MINGVYPIRGDVYRLFFWAEGLRTMLDATGYVSEQDLDVIAEHLWSKGRDGKITCSGVFLENPRYRMDLGVVIARKYFGDDISYVSHLNGLYQDNTLENLEIVSREQMLQMRPHQGYFIDINHYMTRYLPQVKLDDGSIVKGGVYDYEHEACLRQFELEVEFFGKKRFNFIDDRRFDMDLVDAVYQGNLTKEEAEKEHLRRWVSVNPWFAYRYNLFPKLKRYGIQVPSFRIDAMGAMVDANGIPIVPFDGKGHLKPYK